MYVELTYSEAVTRGLDPPIQGDKIWGATVRYLSAVSLFLQYQARGTYSVS